MSMEEIRWIKRTCRYIYPITGEEELDRKHNGEKKLGIMRDAAIKEHGLEDRKNLSLCQLHQLNNHFQMKWKIVDFFFCSRYYIRSCNFTYCINNRKFLLKTIGRYSVFSYA